MDLQLKGHTAIVTGASADIGAGMRNAARAKARRWHWPAATAPPWSRWQRGRSLGAPPAHVVISDVATLKGR